MSIDLKNIKVKSTVPKDKTASSGFIDNVLELFNKDISFGNKGLNDQKKERFYHELQVLLQAGIDIKNAFHMIVQGKNKDKDKAFYQSLMNSVIQGNSLSKAMEDSKQFSTYEFYSIKIGEESGNLSLVLKELAAYFKNNIQLRRQIIQALTYPVLVLCTSFGAIFFMMYFVVPMFSDVFKRFGGKLPALTLFIIDVSTFISNYSWLFLLIIVGLIVFLMSVKNTPQYQKTLALFLLRMPVIGPFVQRVYLARMCASLSLLIKSRVPLLQALALVKKMITFYPIEQSIEKIEKDIIQGSALHKSLEQFDIYPASMIAFVKVGEEVNRLDEFFQRISEQYKEDNAYMTTVIGNMLEPIMILVLGVIVGVILIAMYLPMFSLSNTF